MVYFAMDRLEDALSALLKAVELKPNRATYHCLLAEVYEAMGQYSEADFHFEIAGRLDDYDKDYVVRVKHVRKMESNCG